jgi:hypothetical protein
LRFALLRLSMRISQCSFNAGRACTRLLDCDKSCSKSEAISDDQIQERAKLE